MRLRACFMVVLCCATVRVQADEFRPFTPVQRPVEILPERRVADIMSRLPPIADPVLRDVFDSPDTIWYDRTVMIPGYQDSFGDAVGYPIGFRPNTIAPGLINLAVPGGHGWLFVRKGEFHFPFGRTGGVDDAMNTFVVNFWKLPREGGKLLPVAWNWFKPNSNTARHEWIFPKDTVFGEILFIKQTSGEEHIFEIRTRTRQDNSWTVDVFRPFPTAESFAQALEVKRMEKLGWMTSTSISNLINHLRDSSTLKAATLGGSHFSKAFTTVNGAADTIPELAETDVITQLLRQTPFRSAKGQVWKSNGSLRAYAASTNADFSIVPRNYNASLFEVSDAFCNRCHQDAGRPFMDYYEDVMAYGELWGEDDTFSWHPYENKYFVNSKGEVVNFNGDNRTFRQSFVDSGLLERYNKSVHTASRYQKIMHSWKNYHY